MHFRISLSNQSRQCLVEQWEEAYQAANLRLVKRIHALLYIVDGQAELITAGPEAAGYPSGCWTAVIVQDLILRCFHVVYHPHYICHLLDQLSFSFQKARFVSDHLDEAARSRWLTETWPEILRLARHQRALILFGDEGAVQSFAQRHGSALLSSLATRRQGRYTWFRSGDFSRLCGKATTKVVTTGGRTPVHRTAIGPPGLATRLEQSPRGDCVKA